MKKTFLLLLILTGFLYSQEIDKQSFEDKVLVGGDLGFTFTSSDYKEIGVGLMFRGVAEYYLFENDGHKVGLRGFAGYGLSTGSDNRYKPDGFSTHLYTIALGGTYSLQVSDVVAPFVFLGLKYLRFNPKDSDGNSLPNNAADNYDRNLINFAFELGIRYKLTDKLYGYSSLVPFSLTNDYIDDRASGTNKDFVITLNLGLMYAIDAPWSSESSSNNSAEIPNGIESSPEILYDDEDEAVEQDTESQIAEETAEESENPGMNTEIEISESNAAESMEIDEADTSPSNANIVEELSHKLDIGRVFFDYGETEFGRMEYVELDRLYRIILENEKSKWKITGYTDNKEPVQVHQSLGVQRAYFVLRYFMSKGLDRERFEIVVAGENNPLGDNSTEEGRSKNRRVEISRIK